MRERDGGNGDDALEVWCPSRLVGLVSGGRAALRKERSEATATSSVGTTLPIRLAWPGGGSFMANSGVSGGRKEEEEGDSKGDEEGGASTLRDAGLLSGSSSGLIVPAAENFH